MKMADVVGAGLSDEKEAESDKRGEKCVWNRGARMGELSTKDMAETLGFYERHADRNEQHDTPGEFVTRAAKPSSSCDNRPSNVA